MDGKLEISIDKLPIKRVESLEESGAERFPPDVGYDEKRVDLIRRIDFAWALEKDAKKQKKASKEASSTPWPWQNFMENLQLAHQELSVVIDLINTVEENDAVTVASMTRPKPMPSEVLSDLAVSAATKLQCFRHLGKYFKQSAKGLEEQIAREGKFYGALIRLQQNWKVKRLRLAPNAPSNEGFLFDLFDNLSRDPAAMTRPPSNSVVRVDHDSAGMLSVKIPENSCRYIKFGFVGASSGHSSIESGITGTYVGKHPSEEIKKESSTDDDCIKETNKVLRETHRAIFSEQVFELINREAFNSSLGVNVTGLKENYLRLGIHPGISVFISLVSSEQQEQKTDATDEQTSETSVSPMDTSDDLKLVDIKKDFRLKLGLPNHIAFEIYLEQLFLEHIFSRGKEKPIVPGRVPSIDPTKDAAGLMSHFCMSLAHRIFANKVHIVLENLVWRVPYVKLVSHQTWHARTSSWTLFMRVLDPKLVESSQDGKDVKHHQQLLFHTSVVVKDDCISIEAESSPNVIGPFKGSSELLCSTNVFNCDLVDLPMILLFQIASGIIRWLHEAALMVGIKANRDSLSLSFELDHGEMLSLAAHVDPDDEICCISWWLVLEDGLLEEKKIGAEAPEGGSSRRFLGYLSLDVLYTTLMDLNKMEIGWREKNVIIATKGFPYTGTRRVCFDIAGRAESPVFLLDEILEEMYERGGYTSTCRPSTQEDEHIQRLAFSMLCKVAEGQLWLPATNFKCVLLDCHLSFPFQLDQLIELSTKYSPNNPLKTHNPRCSDEAQASLEGSWNEVEKVIYDYDAEAWDEHYRLMSSRHPHLKMLVLDPILDCRMFAYGSKDRVCPIKQLSISSPTKKLLLFWSFLHGGTNAMSSNTNNNNLCSNSAGDCLFKYQKHVAGGANCRACEQPLDGEAYTCMPFGLALHNSCAEFEPANHLYPDIDLGPGMLTFDAETQLQACKSCIQEDRGFSYECGLCIFETHLKCRLMPTVVCYPSFHPLSIQFNPTEASWRNLEHIHGGHLHLMNLVLSSPDGDKDDKLVFLRDDYLDPDDFYCDVCYDDIDSRCSFYRCQECPDYVAHICCVSTQWVKGYEISDALGFYRTLLAIAAKQSE
ncbi:hypothetical protein V2J09_002874 [Rumex salicifolius]